MTLVQTWLCSSAASWRGVEIFTAPWAVPHTDSPVTGVRAQRQGNTAASPQHGLILTAGWGRQHGWWLAIGGSCRIPLPPRYLWWGHALPQCGPRAAQAAWLSCPLGAAGMGDEWQRGNHALVIITGPIGAKCHFPVDGEQRCLSFPFFY